MPWGMGTGILNHSASKPFSQLPRTHAKDAFSFLMIPSLLNHRNGQQPPGTTLPGERPPTGLRPPQTILLVPSRPSLGSNPGTTSLLRRSPELQTAGRCALQARHGAPEPPEPPESMARKPGQETAAPKVADHARILAATTKPGPGPGPQGDLGRLRRRNSRGSALGERAEGAAYPARRGLSVPASPLRPLDWRLPRAACTQSCLTGVTLAARSTWNPGSLKSSARAGRLPVFLGWPPNGSLRLRPGRLRAGTGLRRGVGSRRVPPGLVKAGCLQVSLARLSGLL
ncbi:uncharacterized protein LOC116069237 [Mastomys coucha]|uniref:uncharacterized protein LOC116069237 n=1 Tax=Mastomys coucha TaxID=35658 RepID=UPI001261EB40|nr:uncharacterized protein LOC116069237 [Mastomys coucha]